MEVPPSLVIRILIRPDVGESSVYMILTITAAEMKYGRKLKDCTVLRTHLVRTSLRNSAKMIGIGKTTTTDRNARIIVFWVIFQM